MRIPRFLSKLLLRMLVIVSIIGIKVRNGNKCKKVTEVPRFQLIVTNPATTMLSRSVAREEFYRMGICGRGS